MSDVTATNDAPKPVARGKVKIFSRASRDDFRELEREIDDWLGAHPDVEIIERRLATTAFSAGAVPMVNVTVALFYRGEG